MTTQAADRLPYAVQRAARNRAFATTARVRAAWPYEPRFLPVDGGVMHYVDEGAPDAAPILAVHGNPTWAFYFRRVIAAFADTHRVVVPDHIGCGLSDKPQDWTYTLAAHVDNLERLVLELDLTNITLVLHDWGGAIGMGFAARHPKRIARLVILNTAAFLSDRIPFRIAVCRTPILGRFAVQGLGAFSSAAVHMAVERPLSREARDGLLAPYRHAHDRIATWKFVEDIPMSPKHRSFRTLQEIGASLARFVDTPTCIVWGEKDWCFTPAFRSMWQARFPDAEVHPLETAGHYVMEDAPEDVTRHMQQFFAKHPVG
ncbi:MAG: alpha/beta fold hydrolase [Planctomycetota bacterium]|nr:MAG: alpha/beta fold hydrolase [Planctomycetota bacterium]